jgi:hypothetical protein
MSAKQKQETSISEQAAIAARPRFIDTYLDPFFVVELKLPGDGPLFVFTWARPLKWEDYERLGEASSAVTAEGGSKEDTIFEMMAALIADTEGVPDFEPRERAEGAKPGEWTESAEAFRARWRDYFRGAMGLLGQVFGEVNSAVVPSARRVDFRR